MSREKDEGRECRPTKTQETGEKGSADSEYAGKSMRIAESLHRKLLAERDAWATFCERSKTTQTKNAPASSRKREEAHAHVAHVINVIMNAHISTTRFDS